MACCSVDFPDSLGPKKMCRPRPRSHRNPLMQPKPSRSIRVIRTPAHLLVFKRL